MISPKQRKKATRASAGGGRRGEDAANTLGSHREFARKRKLKRKAAFSLPELPRASRRPQRARSRHCVRASEGSRNRVKTACTNCKLAKARCDNGRPCSRCVKRGCQDTCIDAIPKRRGRKRNQDGNKLAVCTEEDDETVVHPHTNPNDDNKILEEDRLKDTTSEDEDEDENSESDVCEAQDQIKVGRSMPLPMEKRRIVDSQLKRLNYLIEKDPVEKDTAGPNMEPEFEKGTDLKIYQDESKPTVYDDESSTTMGTPVENQELELSFALPHHPPVINLDSPNNTLSDSEFNALLFKNENQHSTPEFSGGFPLSEPTKLIGFYLGDTPSPLRPTISPMLPLSSWNEGQSQQHTRHHRPNSASFFSLSNL
mmetsp:Transcript_12461/g.14770  ORF Transcript_12461/g.14770 Transcript_12461/m.14770 type:complete len:369 (-) Transcript_12461:333-1439(-)|eukprot:jgi/Bigna1/88351/estExt_fgenesh1_pg.C_310036